MSVETTTQLISIPFWKTRKFIVFAIIMLSIFVHAWAIRRLPEDPDEPVYIGAAADYGAAIRAGDLDAVIDYPGVPEHPALVKLFFSIPFISGEIEKDSRLAYLVTRAISAIFSTVTIALVALIDPIAGILLVFHSIFTKYTSLAMLDAFPTATSMAAVLALLAYKKGAPRWLWISAAALGLTVAGKYTFAIVAIPLLVIFLRRKDISLQKMVLYGLAAVLVFWAANPTLWHDPIGRLLNTAAFHSNYPQSDAVTSANFPWYQPLIWLITTVPLHPSVALYPLLDPVIFAAGFIGLFFERKQRPWIIAWIISGIIVLLFWPTKWPHYTLLITAPLCLSASTTIKKSLIWLVQRARGEMQH